MIFLNFVLKVVLSEFVNMSQQGTIKTFLEDILWEVFRKKHKNINDNKHILGYILFFLDFEVSFGVECWPYSPGLQYRQYP